MLVLTRKFGETIVLGETITITVVEIRGDRVRLGIEAPKEVSVARGELDIASMASRWAGKIRERPQPTI